MKSLISGFYAVILVIVCGCTEKNGGAEVEKQNEELLVQHCAGRLVLQLPGSFSISPIVTGVFKEDGYGLESEPLNVSVVAREVPLNLSSEVQSRNAEIEKGASANVNVLRSKKELDDGVTIFRIQRVDDAFASEILFLRGSSLISARVNSYNGEYLAAEERLSRFAKKIYTMSGTSASEENVGFCLGPVVVKGDYVVEKGQFQFKDERGEQFELRVDTYASNEPVSLLERMSGPQSLLRSFNVPYEVYRSKERTIGGMRGQEWLGSMQVAEEGNEAFQFVLETHRQKPGKSAPSFKLTFETAQPLEDGTQTKTMISQSDAIQRWDRIVNSVHIRASE